MSQIVYVGHNFERAKKELSENGDEVVCFVHHNDFITKIKRGFIEKVDLVFVDATLQKTHAGPEKTPLEIHRHYIPHIQTMSQVCGQFVYIFAIHELMKERRDAGHFCRILLVKMEGQLLKTLQVAEIPNHSWYYRELQTGKEFLASHDYYGQMDYRFHHTTILKPHYKTVTEHKVVRNFFGH